MNGVTVFDVAAHFLKLAGGRLTTMKLQKLCYYAQAWSLVWDDQPLFDAEFTAWANGPVCAELYNLHKGKYWITLEEIQQAGGNPDELVHEQIETCGVVYHDYGKFSGTQLSALTHQEDPWIEARKGLNDGDWGRVLITKDAIKQYYSSLEQDDASQDVDTIEFAPWVV